ncbi:PAS domain S-box protein [Natrialbaceae archaeon A-CW3]
MGSEPLTARLQETLTTFEVGGEPLTTSDVAASLELGRRGTYARLERLVERDHLQTKKVGANARVWWRPSSTLRVEQGHESTGRPTSPSTDVTDGETRVATPRDDHVQFEALVDAVEEYAIFLLDADGHVQTWNSGAEAIKGYAKDDIVGKHVATFYTEANRDAGVPDANLHAAAEHGTIQEEGWRVRDDGSQFWANVTITSIRDDDGALEGYAKVTRDMTDRREREQCRQDERDLLTQILDTSPVGITVVNPDGSTERSNERMAEILGLSTDALASYTAGQLDMYDSNGDVLPVEERPASRALATGDAVTNTEIRIDVTNEQSRWLSINATPVSDDDGSVQYIVVSAADITQLKVQSTRLERQRDELQAELDEVFERISDGFYALDERLRFRYLNDHAASFLGVDESAIGDDIRDEVVLTDSFESALYEARDTQQPVVFEDYYDPIDRWFSNAIYPSGSGLSIYFREITEQKRRERELEQYERIVETVDEGIYVLDGDRRFKMVNEAFASMTGYDREELLGAHAELTFGDHFVETANEKQAELESGEQDVAILEEKLYRADETSIVVESRFRQLPIAVGETGRVGVVRDISERVERERELERQRDQLAALNSINEVGREIIDAVIEQSTREEIEQAVCNALAAADTYEFAWLAAVDPSTDTFTPRATAGTGGYAEEITISLDPDDATSDGPAATAIREQETQIVQDVFSDPSFEPWRDVAAKYGFKSVASVPIVHEGTVYGVLCVYADRQNAFDPAEAEIVSRLGRVVGHAIAAADQKQALLSDDIVELEFQIPDAFGDFDTLEEMVGTITFENTVPVGGGEYLIYGTATPDAIDDLKSLVEGHPHWKDVTTYATGDSVSFQIRMTDPPVISSVASAGGYVERTVIEDGDIQASVHLAPTVGVRSVIDAITDEYPQAEMLRRKQITRPHDDSQRMQRQLLTTLTDRQRACLEAAYHAGFFEWPRTSTGEDVAESMGVAPPTFHQHLRKAERKAFELLFENRFGSDS